MPLVSAMPGQHTSPAHVTLEPGHCTVSPIAHVVTSDVVLANAWVADNRSGPRWSPAHLSPVQGDGSVQS